MEVVGELGFRLVLPRSVIAAEVRLAEKLERDDGSGESVAVDVVVGESNRVGSGESVAVEVVVGESNRVGWEVQSGGWGVCTG